MLRRFLIGLSTSRLAQTAITHFAPAKKMARRFIAGETLDEAVAVVKALNAGGIKALMNEVGDSVATPADARHATEGIKTLLRRINAEGLDATVSLKPSHVGLAFGPDVFYQNVLEIVQTAQDLGNIVEIDMEGSADVDNTLTVYHRLLDKFGGGLRLAVQAYLFRTPTDVRRLVERGTGIRVVKGAYDELPAIAYQDKAAINQAMSELMEMLIDPHALQKGAYLALGSHDPAVIDWLLHEAQIRNISPERFEIQMLQGVRRNEQKRLAEMGYQMRVYVPYGVAWYPYFMRRLAERPANLLFMARAFVGN